MKSTSIALLSAVVFAAAGAHASSDVLVIGDQQLMKEFGTKLDTGLRTAPDRKVTMIAACGATAQSWVNGGETSCGYLHRSADGDVKQSTEANIPLAVTLLSTLKPKYVLVALGSAELGSSSKKIQSTMRALALAIRESGAMCLWLGPVANPASSRAVSDYYAAVREVNEESQCALVDLGWFGALVEEPNQSSELAQATIDVVTDVLAIGEEPEVAE